MATNESIIEKDLTFSHVEKGEEQDEQSINAQDWTDKEERSLV